MYSETSFTLVPEICLEIFLRERESGEPRSVFLSLYLPLRGWLSLSRRKTSRKISGTRVDILVLGTFNRSEDNYEDEI